MRAAPMTSFRLRIMHICDDSRGVGISVRLFPHIFLGMNRSQADDYPSAHCSGSPDGGRGATAPSRRKFECVSESAEQFRVP